MVFFNTPADFSAAARVYWTLKVAGHGPVSILDGGYASWVSANLPVTAGPSIPQGSWPTTKALVDGVVAGCFPQLYGALAGSPPDQVITL